MSVLPWLLCVGKFVNQNLFQRCEPPSLLIAVCIVNDPLVFCLQVGNWLELIALSAAQVDFGIQDHSPSDKSEVFNYPDGVNYQVKDDHTFDRASFDTEPASGNHRGANTDVEQGHEDEAREYKKEEEVGRIAHPPGTALFPLNEDTPRYAEDRNSVTEKGRVEKESQVVIALCELVGPDA